VARMIMSGYEFRGKECFNNVYFTGIVRDKLGRKMSKQLGNSPDPIELMNKYGADSVRMGLMLAAPAGNDIMFDESLCEQGRNFCNKIWNAFRLIQGWEVSEDAPFEDEMLAVDWFSEVSDNVLNEIEDLFSKYRISEALMAVYKLFWDDFCSWYLEMIKPEYGKPINREIYNNTVWYFMSLLKLLHPFMPFITEELWQALKQSQIEEIQDLLNTHGQNSLEYAKWCFNDLKHESIMNTEYRFLKKEEIENIGNEDFYENEEFSFDYEFFNAKEIITNIRNIRASKNISPKEKLTLQVSGEHNELFDAVIKKLANIETIEYVTEKSAASVSFLVGTTEYFVPVEINVEEEIEKMQTEIKYLEGFKKSVQGKLSNEKFVSNAKPEVVEIERKKLADAESKIKSLEEGINQLRIKN
jgi:valyl-tRNA synthetase